MDIQTELTKAFGKYAMGQRPETRETVADCLTAAFFTLLDEYFAGRTPLAGELDQLLKAIDNKHDPFMRGMSVMQRASVQQIASLLRSHKET